MIDITNRRQIEYLTKHYYPLGYYLPAELQPACDDCNMSRLTMSCYAAAKHQYPEKDNKIARMQAKEKKSSTERPNKYGEMESSVALDKYNEKLMNSIWGLYNRNSPHNLKSNADDVAAAPVKEQAMRSEKVGSSSLVQFTIPKFNGIVIGAVETRFEVKKPKTSLEKLETLFNHPPMF